MPGFDGTGPRGEGPMTGGARGFCGPDSERGFSYGRGYGRGFGRGRGMGRGCGRGRGRRFRGDYSYPASYGHGTSKEQE